MTVVGLAPVAPLTPEAARQELADQVAATVRRELAIASPDRREYVGRAWLDDGLERVVTLTVETRRSKSAVAVEAP